MDEHSLFSTFTSWAESAAERQPGALPLNTSTHTIPARRTILHPSESPDFVIVICQGWATSSISLSDGRRQILSFFLPGDIVSTPSLFEPMSGRLIEAVTDVTYRKFKRSELKTLLFKNPNSRKSPSAGSRRKQTPINWRWISAGVRLTSESRVLSSIWLNA